MRKLTPLIALVLLTGFASAVLGADCPPGQPCIMGGGDSGESQSYEPIEVNGSDWTATLKPESSQPANNISEGFYNTTYSTVNGSSQVSFDGVMQVPSSCYYPEIDVTETGENSYEAEITQEQREGNISCTQVITEISYSVNFTADQAFQLETTERDISESFQHPDFQEDDEAGENEEENNENSDEDNSGNGGLFGGFFSWLGSLF